MSKRNSVKMANGSAAANGVVPSYLLTDKVALVTGSGTYPADDSLSLSLTAPPLALGPPETTPQPAQTAH